jgi:two-component sensor histidine kinase
MNIDRAVPVGLIVNELVSNSFKYAFHHTSLPKVMVVLQQTNDKNFMLQVSDNGMGKPVENINGKGSFGLKLVRILAGQLNADIKIENQGGTHFTLQTKVI